MPKEEWKIWRLHILLKCIWGKDQKFYPCVEERQSIATRLSTARNTLKLGAERSASPSTCDSNNVPRRVQQRSFEQREGWRLFWLVETSLHSARKIEDVAVFYNVRGGSERLVPVCGKRGDIPIRMVKFKFAVCHHLKVCFVQDLTYSQRHCWR